MCRCCKIHEPLLQNPCAAVAKSMCCRCKMYVLLVQVPFASRAIQKLLMQNTCAADAKYMHCKIHMRLVQNTRAAAWCRIHVLLEQKQLCFCWRKIHMRLVQNMCAAGAEYLCCWYNILRRQYQVSYGNTKLKTPVPVRSLKLSSLGHAWLALGWVTIQVRSGCCREKYSNISGVEKQGHQ